MPGMAMRTRSAVTRVKGSRVSPPACPQLNQIGAELRTAQTRLLEFAKKRLQTLVCIHAEKD